MLNGVLTYIGWKSMPRVPTSFDPLSTSASGVKNSQRIQDRPNSREGAHVPQQLQDQPLQPEATRTHSDHIRGRGNSVTTASASASQYTLSSNSRRATPERRSTPKPSSASTSKPPPVHQPSSGSTSASQVALKRVESGRHFEFPAERRQAEPTRKRRHTDDDHIRTQLAKANEKNAALEEKLFEARKDLAESIRKNKDSQQKIHDVLDEKSKIFLLLQSAQKQLVAANQDAERRIRELEAANRKKDDELRIAQAKLRASEEKQSHMSQLLEVRTADLNGAQVFLTTTDKYSGAEIIAMMEALNSEVFQTAAFMSELVEDESMRATPQEQIKNVEQRRGVWEKQGRKEIGEELWQHIQNHYSEIHTEPLPLQLAIQCLISQWCAYNMHFFAFGSYGTVLDQLYGRIRESEHQAIAGRWRAITSSNIASFKEPTPVHSLIDILLSALVLCGWSLSSEKARTSLLSIQNMTNSIDRMATQLKAAMKEGITTVDMDSFTVPAGVAFSDNMVDTYAESGSFSPGQRVLCTVGLGLRRSVVKRNENGKCEFYGDILLKPKVALASVLFEDNTK